MKPVASGQRFAMLTAIQKAPEQGRTRWICKCDCGELGTFYAESLARGYRKTCGCSTQKLKHRKHGQTNSPTYVVWSLMRRRCERPANRQEQINYAGKGVRVCERWGSFENFLQDMGERPAGFQIDRIDSNGNYEPSNCRWVTPYQQARNKSSNRVLEFAGKSQCLADWAADLGIAACTLTARLGRLGWSKEKALTTRKTQ